MELKSVMYIGSKTRKDDRVNGDLSRVWPGTGTVVDGIQATQALKLIGHADEFRDVTGKNPEELQALAQQAIVAAEEKLRNARAVGSQKSNTGTLLEYATEDQLEAQLNKIRGNKTLLNATTSGSVQHDDEEQAIVKAKLSQSKDKALLAERIPEAIEAIVGKAEIDLLDENGLPTKSAIEEELGFPLTDDEYADSMNLSMA